MNLAVNDIVATANEQPEKTQRKRHCRLEGALKHFAAQGTDLCVAFTSTPGECADVEAVTALAEPVHKFYGLDLRSASVHDPEHTQDAHLSPVSPRFFRADLRQSQWLSGPRPSRHRENGRQKEGAP